MDSAIGNSESSASIGNVGRQLTRLEMSSLLDESNINSDAIASAEICRRIIQIMETEINELKENVTKANQAYKQNKKKKEAELKTVNDKLDKANRAYKNLRDDRNDLAAKDEANMIVVQELKKTIDQLKAQNVSDKEKYENDLVQLRQKNWRLQSLVEGLQAEKEEWSRTQNSNNSERNVTDSVQIVSESVSTSTVDERLNKSVEQLINFKSPPRKPLHLPQPLYASTPCSFRGSGRNLRNLSEINTVGIKEALDLALILGTEEQIKVELQTGPLILTGIPNDFFREPKDQLIKKFFHCVVGCRPRQGNLLLAGKRGFACKLQDNTCHNWFKTALHTIHVKPGDIINLVDHLLRHRELNKEDREKLEKEFMELLNKKRIKRRRFDEAEYTYSLEVE